MSPEGSAILDPAACRGGLLKTHVFRQSFKLVSLRGPAWGRGNPEQRDATLDFRGANPPLAMTKVLAAQAEAFDQRTITSVILALQIVEQTPAAADEHQQAAT